MDVKSSPITLTTRRMVRRAAHDFYGDVLQVLTSADVPITVGGAFALKHYAGVVRDTKDLDVFLRREDVPKALRALQLRGYMTEDIFPHWLAKAYSGVFFVDFIHNSANGLCPVDDVWFEHAHPVLIFDVPALLCPVEDVIWTKAFVMERERFDGADICHLIAACGRTMDWHRLLQRFGDNWRVLLGHLCSFTFVYPSERDIIPKWVLDHLLARMDEERAPEPGKVCKGTLLSREQYLVDVRERNLADARLEHVDREDIARWTEAIGKIA